MVLLDAQDKRLCDIEVFGRCAVFEKKVNALQPGGFDLGRIGIIAAIGQNIPPAFWGCPHFADNGLGKKGYSCWGLGPGRGAVRQKAVFGGNSCDAKSECS